MSKAYPEATSAWITERMQAVLSSHRPEDVKATMPVILMFMVDGFGIDNLEPAVQAAVQKVFTEAGIQPRLGHAEVARRMKAYIGATAVHMGLLEQIRGIFDTHYAAVNEDKASGLRRFFGKKRAPRPATYGTARPAGIMSAAQLCMGPRRV